MNTELHAVTDANGRPLSFFMTAGQVNHYTGAAALLDELPKAQWLLGDRGYDADWFRDALEAKGIQPCIPGRKSRNEPVRCDKRRYRRRSRIEIMFGRLKDWRRVATPLRPVFNRLLLRRRPRCHRHLLAMTNES
ncbi:MAG: transposase [Sphingomonas bacterium]|nr:transposase [Sphingomonas bacterium]